MTDTTDTQPEKLPLTSMDIAEEKRRLLKQCLAAAFPEAMAEDKIDFDQLKRVLGEWVEPDRERFGLNWPGKAACMKVIQAPSVGTLKPCPEESVDWDTTENLFIEGDNLEVLKLLQKAYFGKVKMIYIDPPYNTGNEFIYPDKYAETLETYLEYTRQTDSDGRKFSTNTETSGRFHSRWLNMMYPRLYLAKNLLREDGVAFISIDDHEAPQLRKLCDQIFGENNFVAQCVWQKRYSRENRGVIGDAHEYVICYARDADLFKEASNLISTTDAQKKAYSHDNNDGKGPWRALPMTAQGYRPNQMYEIFSPTGKVFTPPEGRCWSMVENEFRRLEAEGRVYFGKDGNAQPGIIRYLSEVKGVVPWTWWPHDETGHTDEAKKEVREYLGHAGVYDTPKPIRLINRMLEIGTRDGDLVCDFFAGSASTGHAIYEHAIAENKKIAFIMIQLPEVCDTDSDAAKAGFQTIFDIGYERLHNVIGKLHRSYLETHADLGFRIFKLKRSCFRQWNGSHVENEDVDLLGRIQEHEDHLDEGASSRDILFELLLKDGFPLTAPVERREVSGKEVFAVADGTLLICLEKELTQELMDALAEMEPVRVICLDAGFKGNDQLKANAVQTFNARARTKETAIEFRTV